MEHYPTNREIYGIQKILDELTVIEKTLSSKTSISDTEKLLLQMTKCLYEVVDILDNRVNECESELNILQNYGHF